MALALLEVPNLTSAAMLLIGRMVSLLSRASWRNSPLSEAANQLMVGSPRRGDHGRLGEPSLPPTEPALLREKGSGVAYLGDAPDTPMDRVMVSATLSRFLPGMML